MKQMGRPVAVKKIYYPFTYTNLTKEDLFDNFKIEFENEKLYNVMKYIEKLDEYERVIFLLYTEYNNYSLVSEETNTSRSIVYEYIKKIQFDLQKIIK